MRTKRLLAYLSLACFCLIPLTRLHAAPYGPEGMPIEFTQPDGTKINLRVFGDEFYGHTVTDDGYTVVFDPATKTYHYATLSPDGNEFASTGMQVGKANPATLGIGKGININPAARAAKARKNYGEFESVVKQEERWKAVKDANRQFRDFKEKVKQQEKAGKKGFVIPMGTLFPDSAAQSGPDMEGGDVQPSGEEGPEMAPPSFQLTGDVVGLTILVDFSDAVGTIAQKDVDDYCNKPGFNLWSNKGSIYDYFYVQSASRLRYTNDVTYYVRVPQPKTYYDDATKDSGLCGRLLLNDALDVLLANDYDFSKFTTKSGGNIRACNVYFAGANSGVWAKGLWPHRWVLSPSKAVGGGKYIYDYQITNMGNSLTIGTFCHENGHMLLGYPDYYDYATDGTDSRGMGSYTLMAYSGLSTNPHNIHAYLKWHSGWIDAIELYGAATPQRLAARVDSDTVYKYTNPAKSTEYIMLENRAKFGWEANGNLPDTGLFITHNDQLGKRDAENMTEANHYECSVVQADGNFHLEKNTNAGDASDLFHSGGTGPKTEFNDTTSPRARWWLGADGTAMSGANTGLKIHSISAVGESMTFVFGEGTPAGSPVIGLDANTIYTRCNYGTNAPSDKFTLFNAGGGTLNYTITDNQDWLSVTPASGTATTGSTLVGVNFSTNTLAAGNYTATITVSDPSASPISKTITVNLTVNPQPTLAVSSASLTANGISGISGANISFGLSNTGGGLCSYSLSKTQPWLTLSPTSGTLLAETDMIFVTCNATSLAPGTYHDTITVTSAEASNSPLTIPITFTVDGEDMILTAPNGGEFFLAGASTTITWLSSLGGNVKIELLSNGAVVSVIAASIPNNGSFAWTIPTNVVLGANYRIRITPLSDPSKFDDSNVDFTISEQLAFYQEPMSTNPGWTLQSPWAWGVPTGGRTPRPTAGFTGANVLGYNLAGDYANSMAAPIYATSTAIDCSGFGNVQFAFRRWLGVESSTFDKATVEVSNNGSNWTQVWANPASLTQDSAWTLVTYDISAVADGQSTVYLRWSIGPTDSSVVYSGWHIDDVTLTGFRTNFDDTTLVLNLAASSVSEAAGVGATTGTVSRVGTSGDLVVSLTSSNTAKITVPATVTIANGQTTSAPFNLNAIDNLIIESTITVTITASATGYLPGSALIDVTDNDNNAPVVNAGSDQTIFLTGNLWSPIELAPKLWLDADDDTTITLNGATVSQWVDKSGFNRHATATTTSQPTATAAGLNGKRVLTFDGSTDVMNVDLDFLAGVSHSAFIVAKPTSYSNIYGAANASAGENSLHVGFTSAANYRMNFWANDYAPALTSNFRAGSANVLNFAWTTGVSKQIFANGGSEGTNTNAGVIGTMSGGGRIGRTTNHAFFGGDIAEFIAITGTLSQADRQSMEGYLAHKWGVADWLPVAHPYKAEGPNNAEAIANLDGSATDADNHPLTTLWTVVSGPAPVTFGDAGSIDTTATFATEGIYTLRLTAADGFTQISDDVVITVNPAAAGYNVTYSGNNSSGGSVPVDVSNPYLNGATVTVLGNTGSLVRAGYTFNNWNTAADGSGTSYAGGSTFTISAHTSLYAQWAPISYTVTFNRQSGTGGSSSVTATSGSAMPTATAPTRTGYTFGGYYTEVSGGGTQYYTAAMASSRNWDIASNTTLYARWTPNTYTVTFDPQSGTGGSASVIATYGSAMPTATAPSRTGYTFGGYYTQVSGGGTQYYSAAMTSATNWNLLANTILYAQWTANLYNVAFEANGGTLANPTGKQVTFGSTYGILATTSRTGHAFNGWFTAASGGTVVTAETVVSTAANHTLYAQWTADTYVINYLGNGNTGGNVPTGQTKIHDTDLPLATNSGQLTKTDYSFVGWNTAADGSGTDYATGAIYTANAPLTLYAKWTPGADGTWAQTTTGPFDWGASGNWSGGIVAAGADRAAFFTPNITATQTVNLDSARTIGNITFTDSTTASHDLTISGANVLTLSRISGVPVVNVTNRTLTISSQISGNNGLQKNGAGILILSGTANNYTGETVINGGVLQPNNPAALGGSTVIRFNGNSELRAAHSASPTFTQGLTIENNVTGHLNAINQFYHMAVSGPLSGSGSLLVGGTDNGSGNITLSNTGNSHTGPIRIGNTSRAGNLFISSIADGAGAIELGGTTGAGNLTFQNTNAAQVFNTRQVTLTGTTGGGVITNNGATANTLTFVQNLAITGIGNKSLTLGGSNTGSNTFVGNISNSATPAAVISLSKTGTGTWALRGTNAYGNTTVAAGGGRLIFQGLQALPTNTTLTLTQNSSSTSAVSLLTDNANTSTLNNTLSISHANSVLGINVFVGNNNTANGGSSSGTTTGSTIAFNKLTFSGLNNSQGLVGIGSVTGANGYRLQFNNVELPAFAFTSLATWTARITANTAPVTLGGTIQQLTGTTGFATNPVLSLAGTNANNQVTGNILDAVDYPANSLTRPLAITKMDSGSWTLSGANAYTGTTTISGGTLEIGGSGTLGSGNYAANISIASTNSGNLKYNTSANQTLGGVISGAGALVKDNSGTLTLTNANTYTGNTTVSAGKLFINGSLSNSAVALNVSSGATLGGTGTIGRNVTIADGGKLEFEISTAAASHDRLDISAGRGFAFSGASVLTITSSSGASPGIYTLVTGGNNITGLAPATVHLPLGWTANVSVSGNSLLLEVISVSGPGPVDHFVISGVPSQATVGTAITGITLTAQDAANETATSFTGTVTFDGTAGITGTSGSFVAGVLSGVSVTSAVAGPNLTLTVADGAGHTGSFSFSVQTLFQDWAGDSNLTGGDAVMDADPDGDGLTNLQEFAFGTNPTAGRPGPVSVDQNGDITPGIPVLMSSTPPPADAPPFEAVFTRRKDRAMADITYTVEFSADLGVWTLNPAQPSLLADGGEGDLEVVSVPFLATVPVAVGDPQPPKFFRVSVSASE